MIANNTNGTYTEVVHSLEFKKMMVRGLEILKYHRKSHCVIKKSKRVLFMDVQITNLMCGVSKDKPTKSIPLVPPAPRFALMSVQPRLTRR